MYHGHDKKPPFFEGWYFKLVSRDESERYAIIPGVILGKDAHAFIQVLNGAVGKVDYYSFALQDFWASKERFELRIGANTFSQEQITLDIERPEGQVKGQVRFEGVQPWPVTLFSPGIMGWYAWVPAMECYHGVLSFDHALQGGLNLNGAALDFDGGRGYIEKDWGQSFPEAWVWFQSNHFQQPGTCITASVAVIPWRGSTFNGFIIGVWHQQQLYRFATYSGARIEALEIGERQVSWTVSDCHYRLEMRAERAAGGLLRGPTKVEMGKRVDETLNASVEVKLTRRTGEVIFAGRGKHAGLEVFGEIK